MIKFFRLHNTKDAFKIYTIWFGLDPKIVLENVYISVEMCLFYFLNTLLHIYKLYSKIIKSRLIMIPWLTGLLVSIHMVGIGVWHIDKH